MHGKFSLMRFLRYFSFFVVLSLLLFTNCAKRGTITGGPKDTLAPVILSSSPENFSTNFKSNTIQINFDEYVKLNKVNQQLIISPPMETQPEIIPMGYPSKFIKIKIFDTLKENTTYSFNFGESIQDNNEGNPYSNYKYVFSTGSYIDSLKLAVTFKDPSVLKKSGGTVNVLLYEAEGFNDSTIYKKKPLYIASSKDSLAKADLENLKEGSYYLIALQEKSSNYKFDPKGDKIGFLPHKITIPSDSTYHVTLFNEAKKPNAYRPAMVSQNKWLVPYEGDVRELKVSVKGDDKPLKSFFNKVPDKDSIYVYTPIQKFDSIQFDFNAGDYQKTYKVSQRNVKPVDTLQIKFNKSGSIQFRDTLAFTTNTPVVLINKELINLIGKDSVQVPFLIKTDTLNNAVKVLFDKKEDEKYTLSLKPNSITDFYETSLKTEIVQSFQTGRAADYGTITYSISGDIHYPVLFELLTKDEKVYDTLYLTEEKEVTFKLVAPDKYYVRIIEDANKNKRWDSGNYLAKQQPEKVYLFQKEFDVRANWDIVEELVLP